MSAIQLQFAFIDQIAGSTNTLHVHVEDRERKRDMLAHNSKVIQKAITKIPVIKSVYVGLKAMQFRRTITVDTFKGGFCMVKERFGAGQKGHYPLLHHHLS